MHVSSDMGIRCWSVRANTLDPATLPRLDGGMVEIASIGDPSSHLPNRVAVWAGVSYRKTHDPSDPPPSPNDPGFFAIPTQLVDSRKGTVTVAWCNLMKHDLGAVHVSLQAAIKTKVLAGGTPHTVSLQTSAITGFRSRHMTSG